MEISIESKIEALLFWKAEPISIKKLSNILNVNEEIIKESIIKLKNSLIGRGLMIIENENEIALGTSKEISALIESLQKDELIKDLGKAGLETLSIILYQSPISRSEIDYIRGVNSQFIIRSLLIRGLIEKYDNEKDQRSFYYKPTLNLLAYLGVSKIDEIPDFEKIRAEIENFKKNVNE